MNVHETECTIMHEGRAFTADGAHVTPEHLLAYLGTGDANRGAVSHKRCGSSMLDGRRACCAPLERSGPVTTWHGEVLGRYTLDSSREQWGTRVYYVTITLTDGAVYYGRSQGSGMYVKAKRKASQLRKHLTSTRDPR